MSNITQGNFSLFLRLLLIGLFWLSGAHLEAEISDPDGQLTEANQLFEADDFTSAQDLYLELFEEGYYSEEMLYRMAFIYEKLDNYPEAIYFLRKAAKEFGPQETEEKVRALLRSRRVARIFSGGFWDKYFAFYRSWSWLIWMVFALGVIPVIGHWLLGPHYPFKGRKLAFGLGLTFLLLAGSLLTHRIFMVPERAVIVDATSFYRYPSYGAERETDAFGLGETVFIESEEDIWYEISAGNRVFWVPYMAIRKL